MKRLLLLWLFLAPLLSLQAAPERAGDEPVRKNYLMAHVGLFPTDYGIYHSIPDSDQWNFVGSFRYFGPVFGITYGRQFNDFLAAEGYLFLSFITRTDMPDELTVYDYLTTRYGAGAGLIVTPLGRWFRFLKVGAVLGYVRKDAALRPGWPALCPLRRGQSPMPVRERRLPAQNGELHGKLRL